MFFTLVSRRTYPYNDFSPLFTSCGIIPSGLKYPVEIERRCDMSRTEFLINYKTLGRHIQIARKAKHMTQEMLAEKMDVSVGHVGKIERGEKVINLERLAEISLLLNVPIEDLLAGCVDRERDAIPIVNALTQEKVDIIYALLKGQPDRVVKLATTLVHDVVQGMNAPEEDFFSKIFLGD